MLTLSGIALFISITTALPEKIAIIGLDLSESKETAGWFLFAILGYFLLKFTIFSIFEVIKKMLPKWIRFRGKDFCGEILGLSDKEICHEYERQDQSHENIDFGTVSGEAESLNRQREKLAQDSNSKFVTAYNLWVYISDIIFPIIFGGYGLWALYRFLEGGTVLKFT